MNYGADLTLTAGGNIGPCLFAKLSTSADFTALVAGANEVTIGITDEGSRNAPGTAADDGLMAVAGENINVFGPGRVCLLTLGGTVARGARIKSDANGAGVTVATTGTTVQEYGAIALQSGTSGQKIRVRVTQGAIRPALA